MPTITHPPRRLIRELPVSLRPATRLARVGSNQLTITELIALVLNTADGLDLAQEIVCRFTVEDLPQTTLTELQQLYGVGPSRAGQLLAAIELGRLPLDDKACRQLSRRSPTNQESFRCGKFPDAQTQA